MLFSEIEVGVRLVRQSASKVGIEPKFPNCKADAQTTTADGITITPNDWKIWYASSLS